GLGLLHGLAGRDRAEGVDVALLYAAVDQLPQLLGAALGERVLGLQAAAQAHHVGGRIGALDAGPARVVVPLLLQRVDLVGAVFVVHAIVLVSKGGAGEGGRSGARGGKAAGQVRS